MRIWSSGTAAKQLQREDEDLACVMLVETAIGYIIEGWVRKPSSIPNNIVTAVSDSHSAEIGALATNGIDSIADFRK